MRTARSTVATACATLAIALLLVGVARAAVAGPVLSLDAFLADVLRAHPLARAADLEPDVAAAEVLAAQGGFDPVLRSGTEFKQDDGVSKTDKTDTVIEQPLPWLFGPRVYAGYKRNVGTNVDPEDVTSDAGESRVGVAVSLLQGVLTDRRRASLDKAELRPDLAAATRRFERSNLVRAAALRYADWAEAAEQVAIQHRLLDIAVDRARFTAERVREGDSAPIDAVEAEQEVERRRGDTARMERALEQAAIEVGVFLWNADGTPRALVGRPSPLPRPAPFEKERIARERADAVRLRPEIERARAALAAAEIDVELANELWWPNVEAFAETIQPDLGAPSVDQYKVGFTVSHPLLFRTPDAQRTLARVAAHRAWLQKLVARRAVDADVDNAISALERAFERCEAGARDAALAAELADAERERLAAGESSLLLVNLRERAAAEAESRFVTAKADYLRAVVTYEWAVGAIADAGLDA